MNLQTLKQRHTFNADCDALGLLAALVRLTHGTDVVAAVNLLNVANVEHAIEVELLGAVRQLAVTLVPRVLHAIEVTESKRRPSKSLKRNAL